MSLKSWPVFGCFAVAIQSFTICSNSAVVMPACVAMTTSISAWSPPASVVCKSPLSSEANGSVVFHSGCCGTSALTRSSAKYNCTGTGCSHHRVPSLSKVAMRSGTGTKSGEPGLVTFSTKAMMDCFAGPSFHDGKGSSTGMIDLPPAILRRRVSGTAHIGPSVASKSMWINASSTFYLSTFFGRWPKLHRLLLVIGVNFHKATMRRHQLLHRRIDDHAVIIQPQHPEPSPCSRRARGSANPPLTVRRQCAGADNDPGGTASHGGGLFIRGGRRYPSDDVPTVEGGTAGP